MDLVAVTLRIYRDAALDAGRAFVRSAWALVLLLLLFPLLVGVGTLTAPLGIFGGFLLAFVNAACAGTYLATLQDALSMRKAMGFDVVRGNLGRHAGDVISVLFPLWVVDLGLSLVRAPTVVVLLVSVAVFLLFNPAPEMIGRARSRGLDLLQDCLTFMQGNGPEWLLPQVVLLAPLVALTGLGHLSIALSFFGPRFGFVHAGSLAMDIGAGPVGWALGVGTVALVHLFMLFRGALYVRLGSGGRRQRAWRARMGG